MNEHELMLEQHELMLEQQHEFGITLDVVIVVPGKTLEEAIVNMEQLSKEEVLKNALTHLPFIGARCC